MKPEKCKIYRVRVPGQEWVVCHSIEIRDNYIKLCAEIAPHIVLETKESEMDFYPFDWSEEF
jgi:hypothetical protein